MRLSDRARKWLPWLLLFIVLIAAAAVYWPGVTGGWVFDDYPNIVDNAAIHITQGHSTLAAWVNAALSSPASFLLRPLASITFALNWYFGNGNPWPFKVTNIVIHLINGVLLFCMLRALLRLMGLRDSFLSSFRDDPQDRTRNRFHRHLDTDSGLRAKRVPGMTIESAAATRLALIVSAAWMLLPINLMAVLYVVQRMESLCQVFVLAGLWAYLHGRWMMLTAKNARRDRHGFALAVSGIVFGTVLGLTSKETAVLLPVFAFLAEWILLRFARSVPDGHGARSALHTRLVIPGRPAGSNPESVWLTATSQHPAAGPGEPQKRHETDSGSPLRGVRNDESNTDDKHVVIPGRPAGSNPESVWLTATSQHPVAGPGEPQKRHETDSGSPLRGVRNDYRGDVDARNDDGSGADGPDDENNAAHKHVVIPGRPAGSNPESVSWLPGEQNPESRSAHDKRIWALFTVTLFVPAVLGFAWLLRGALRPAAWSGRDFTLTQRLLTEPRVLVDYLHWTLFPNPMVLSLYHDEIVKSTGLLTPWTTLGAIVLLAALIVIAIWLRKRHPLVSLGIGWFFAAQLLTATIVPLELVYEQRMYFGSIGVLLAAGVLLLGLRWRIALPILRGFIVFVAVLWFAVATNLRAQEWSNPLRLAIAEANRHPESPRAVYEAGRLLLIASNYAPGKTLDASWKYLGEAAAIPGSSALADQAMIMIADHHHEGADDKYWDSMVHKLRDQPTRQEDISALISLTNCYDAGICKFDVTQLERAYRAALSRPHPIARLDGAYADFQRDILHNDKLATDYLARAVNGAPSEPAYRVDLAALYARQGQTGKALEQIDALRRMNLAGRLDRQIATLERLAEQGKTATPAHD